MEVESLVKCILKRKIERIKRSVSVDASTHSFHTEGPEFDPRNFSKEAFFDVCRKEQKSTRENTTQGKFQREGN